MRYKFDKMTKERRHVCTYCHKKRIERRMITVQSYTLDNLPNGQLWACWHRGGWNNLDCAVKYYDMRAAEFYLVGDKMKSAGDKLRKYNK